MNHLTGLKNLLGFFQLDKRHITPNKQERQKNYI